MGLGRWLSWKCLLFKHSDLVWSWVVEAHVFNPSSWEAEAGGSEIKVSLLYRASPRTSTATQKNPVSKNQPNKQKDPSMDSY